MAELNPNQSSAQTQIIRLLFSNLNVMNDKPTVNRGKSPQQSYTPDLTQPKLGFQTKNEVCIQHSYPIEYLCFSCSSCLLCPQCLTSSSHHGHDLRNLQRSRQLMRSQLQEWNILLETRCEILGMWSDRLRNNRADIFEYAELYKQKLAAQFKELMNRLEQQLASITNSITDFSNDYKNDYTEKAKQIRLRQIEIKSMIEENTNRIQAATIQMQAQYYSSNKSKIDELLDQSEIVYYKQLLIEPNWGIDAESFKNINTMISRLNITFKSLDAQKQFSDFREKIRESLKKSIKRSKKQLKLMDLDRYDRVDSKSRNSNNCISQFVSTFTPKNKSLQRRIKNKKSPGETLLKKKKRSQTKMVSMPVSPEKDMQKISQPSPNASNKHLFKKK